jgi:hypothetical protein
METTMFKRLFVFVVIAVVIATVAFVSGAFFGPSLGLGPGSRAYGMGPWMHGGWGDGFRGMPFGMGRPFGWGGFLLFGGLQFLFWAVVVGVIAWLVARLIQPRAPASHAPATPSQTSPPSNQAQ